MKVGDLVRFRGMEFGVGIIIRYVAMYADTVEVMWSDQASSTLCSTGMLEMINESR